VEEQVVLLTDGVFRWDGPKRKATIIGANLGRVVLTDQRLLFLSSGSNDLTVGKVVASGLSRGVSAAFEKSSSTESIDLSGLDAKGGLEVPVSSITGAELKGMFKYLVVRYKDQSGAEQATTFCPKNGGMPDGPTWVAEINRVRGG
jgi:hypothetical protein